jgi:hypothetical protein
MRAKFGQPTDKEPTRYELRIGDYMRAIELGEAERQAVWAGIGSHKLLLGRTVKDVFLDNGTMPADREGRGDLWIFTSDAVSRYRTVKGDAELEFISHRDVRHVSLIAHASDIFSVGPHSAMSLRVEFVGHRLAELSAAGVNCLYLLTMFRKYFSRRMAP